MLVAGPNLTTDRTLFLDELRPGEVLRFSRAEVTPGGKGVNVLRVARSLGHQAVLAALAPGRTGRAVVELIEDEGLPVVPVAAGGEVRAASIILEESGRVTVLNEPGPAIGEPQWRSYEQAVEGLLPDHSFLVCIGSTPPGSPPDGYARLVRLASGRSVRSLVDASGEGLAQALESRPDFVSPNLVEAEGVLLGTQAQPVEGAEEARGRALEAAAALVRRGARAALVTAGAAGIAVDAGSKPRWLEPPPVSVRNPIGAGDALVAALVGSLERGMSLEEALQWGVGAAAASVEMDIPGYIDPARVRTLGAKAGP